MELILKMKHVARLLLFLGSSLVWLIALVALNDLFLNVSDTVVVVAALLLSAATTVGLAVALRT